MKGQNEISEARVGERKIRRRCATIGSWHRRRIGTFIIMSASLMFSQATRSTISAAAFTLGRYNTNLLSTRQSSAHMISTFVREQQRWEHSLQRQQCNRFMSSNFISYRSISTQANEKPSPSLANDGVKIDSSATSSKETQSLLKGKEGDDSIPIHCSEGLFAVIKPLKWTSQDVVSFIRRMLERDARERGAKVADLFKRGNKKRKVRVGHGGTLDPLASGVLVIGVGSGTKKLQGFLSGTKKYRAGVKLGFETTTLDMDEKGEIIKTAPFDHITLKSIQDVIPSFTGKIMQTPPIFSAIRKDGKKLYEEARKGKTDQDVKISAREVEIYSLELLPTNDEGESLPSFGIEIECGGGTYVRSLIRDIGHSLNSVATMTSLVRTQQGPFGLEHALEKDDWNVENIYAAIDKTNKQFSSLTNHEDTA